MTGTENEQLSEIEELRGRLAAAEKKIEILTETLSTMKDIRSSEQMSAYLSSQTRLIQAAAFLNTVSDKEKFDIEEQKQTAAKVEAQKRSLDERIDKAVKESREQSLMASNTRIAEAIGKWKDQQPKTTDESALKFLSYRVEDGGITITGFRVHRDFEGEVIVPDVLRIPDEIGGMPVRKIGEGAFRNVKLNRLVLPEQLNSIGRNAFSACRFESISFPDSLSVIGAGAFASCEFSEIHLENTGVRIIPEKCFGWCMQLKKIVFPDTLTSIENNAFVECVRLQQLIVPESTKAVISPFSNSSVERSVAILGMETELMDLCGITLMPGAVSVTVYCLPDSAAQRYCLSNKIPCRHLKEYPQQ